MADEKRSYLSSMPDRQTGLFGGYGGSFIPPHLQTEMDKLTNAYRNLAKDADFLRELAYYRKHYQGRPTPISYCKRLTEKIGGARIYLKREDLNHGGAHKMNHCIAECLVAKSLGKKKVIAETGAGQHGVALATAAALFGLKCEIYMGAVDVEKEAPNVSRMKILGATVVSVTEGAQTLKEAVDAAFTAYLTDCNETMFCIGSVVGPHPFPLMVREFQRVVGIEARNQMLEMIGGLPDHVVACVGGGSNAMGIFSAFIEDNTVSLHAVEPGGTGTKLGQHAASLSYGKEGVMHGFNSIMLSDEDGQPAAVHSIASGLDYPSVGPEHAYLNSIGRTIVGVATDDEVIEAFYSLSRYEGIIPALESAHAVAYAMKLAKESTGQSILINLSGRGDKDLDYVLEKYPEALNKVY